MKEYSFFNLPVKCRLQEYKETKDIIIKKYSETDGLISIYSWGNISVAGISDIDILFVFGKNPKPLPFLRRSFNFLDRRSRYLARHPFVFIGEDSFQKVRYVYPETNFKLLYGKKLQMGKLSASEKYDASIALLNDLIIRHYPRDFTSQAKGNSINVRDTLLRLNSIKYSVEMLEFISKQKYAEWRNDIKRIESLRKSWFDEKDYGELIELNERALALTIDFIEKFHEFLSEKRLVRIKGGGISYNGIKNRTLFVKNWNKKAALKNGRSVLPLEFASQLVKYSNYNGPISHYIAKNLSSMPECQIGYMPIVKERIKILNSQAELACKLKHSDFAAYFDFGYRSPCGVNNWVMKLLDKLRFSFS